MKVAIFQPLVPAYRVPLYELLGKAEDVELTVLAGGDYGSLKAINEPSYYNQKFAKLSLYRVLGTDIRWQQGQFTAIQTKQYDLLIVSWDVHYVNLLFVILYARLAGIPIVLWGHGFSKHGNGFRDFVRNLYGKLANAVLVYSNTASRNLVENFSFDKERVFVAQNAINTQPQKDAQSYWNENSNELSHFRNKYKLVPEATIIFVSRLEPDNEIEMLLYGMKKIIELREDAKLVIVGHGSSSEKLKAKARDLDVDESTIFTGAIYDELELAPWMMSSTLFCYPRNIGLSIFHAFSYGIPVVTGDDIKSHNPEIEALINNENGLLFRDKSVEDMVEQWLKLIENPQLRNSMGQNAVNQVETEYNLENMADGFRAIFNRLVNS